MLFIHKTVALCDKCYRHIPGNVIEENGQILLKKLCPEHGEMTGIVETDTEFYYGLKHDKPPEIKDFMEPMLFEVTDKCQLNCPHCYHMPDNKTEDRSLSDLKKFFSKLPKTAYPMMAGAEPTLRSDFVSLCKEICDLGFPKFLALTNGLKFSDADFTKDCYNAGLRNVCIGLNHPNYQGQKVHNKQLRAIDNLILQGYDMTYIGYTIQSLDEISFILEEIKMLHGKMTSNQKCHFRIRCGSFIGRSSDQHRSYLSSTVKKVKEILGDEVTLCRGDDNPYHVVYMWGDIIIRLIQWPDVTNMDLEELDTGPWCQFYDGPITNFVHQVITRDAYINMKMPALDLAPTKYRYEPTAMKSYWKDNWTEPVPVKELDWNWLSPEATPIQLPKIIPITFAKKVIL
jgi:hypothetical protein